jgi:hypothetical protein
MKKYLGVELARKGDAETLAPFHMDLEWTYDEYESAVIDCYNMIRNLLSDGVPLDYMKRMVDEGVAAMPSPFASCQDMAVLPLAQAKLVAPEEVVARVLYHGMFVPLEDEAVGLARTLRDIVTLDDWMEIESETDSDEDYVPDEND